MTHCLEEIRISALSFALLFRLNKSGGLLLFFSFFLFFLYHYNLKYIIMKAFLILLSMVVIFFALLFKRNADISPINTTRDDILFKYFPSHSTRLLKSGTKVPDYFQAYAADLLIIHGFSDLEVATKKVRGQLYPVEFQGKAYSELWV